MELMSAFTHWPTNSVRHGTCRFCSIPSIPAVAVVHSFSDSSQPGSPGSPFPLGRNIKEGSQTACGRDAFRARACDMGQAETLPHSLAISSYRGEKCNFQRYLAPFFSGKWHEWAGNVGPTTDTEATNHVPIT